MRAICWSKAAHVVPLRSPIIEKETLGRVRNVESDVSKVVFSCSFLPENFGNSRDAAQQRSLSEVFSSI